MTRSIVFAACVAWCRLSLAAGADQTYTAHRLPGPPVLDGFPESESWRHAADAGGTFWILGKNEPAERQTRFRMGYTDEALFIGVVCKEPQIGLIQAAEPDGGALWGEDSVELYVYPPGAEPLQFIVNAVGSRWSQVDSTWEAAAAKGPDYWSIEVRMPWQTLGIEAAPSEGQPWRFTVGRNVRTRWAPARNTVWTRMEGSYLEPDNFAKLEFAGPIQAAAQVALTLARPIDDAAGQESEARDMLAFSRHHAGTFLITEAGEERLLFNQGVYVVPRIAPSGQRMLFHSTQGGALGVWMLELTSGATSRIADGTQASWSRDERKIVYVVKGTAVERNLDAGTETRVSPPGWDDCRWPVFAPGGGALLARANGLYHTGRPVALVEAEVSSPPSVSPDGSRVAYQAGAHLFVMELATGGITQHTFAPGVQGWPAWTSDGRGLVYLQKHDPLAVTGDVYYQACGSPTMSLVEREVLEGLDWHGGVPRSFRDAELPGLGLHAWPGTNGWETAKTPPAGATPWPRVGAVGAENHSFGHDLGSVQISTRDNRMFFAYGRGDGTRARVEVKVRRVGGDVLDQITRVEAITSDPQSPRLRLTLAGLRQTAEPVVMEVALADHLPLVKFEVQAADVEIMLRDRLEIVVVPDRLSRDLVVGAEEIAEQPATLAGHHRLVLGLGGAGSRMLVCLLPGADVPVALAADGNGSTELRVRGNSITLGGLSHPDHVWMTADVVRPAGVPLVNWRHPYLAAWRLTAIGATGGGSRLLNETDLGAVRGEPFEVPGCGLDGATRVVAYVHSRGKNTPLDVLTPKDLVLARCGIAGAFAVMQTREARCYRTSANRHVPFLDLTKPREDALPKQGYGVLDAFAGIAVVPRPTLKQFVEHLSGDAVELLRGLDDRLAEYESFFGTLSRDEFPEALLTVMRERRAELDRSLAAHEAVPLETVATQAGRIAEAYGRGWEAFREVCLKSLADRQARVGLYRQAVCDIREQAKRLSMFKPECRQAWRDLAAQTDAVLKHRFYLESEWLGESPGSDILWHP